MIVTANPAVAIGDKVRILATEYPNSGWLEGAEIEADRAYMEGSSYFIVPGQGHISCTWEIVIPEEPANRYTPPVSYEVLREQVERLTKDLTLERLRHQETEQDRQTIIADFSIVSDALLEEAQERNWCEEYDQFVNRVNRDTKRMELQNCEVEFEVKVQRVRTVYEQTTVLVSGRRGSSEYDLAEAANEAAWNAYDWDEYDDDVSDEYEILEISEA